MGIFINLAVSKAVTEEEWEKVYEETVELVEKLPLAEVQKVEIHGIDTLCVVPTKERELYFGSQKIKGWRTSGDKESLGFAECFSMYKNFVSMHLLNLDAGDAILGVIPEYLEEDNNDSKFKQVYRLWGSKTQGEDYHIYLLAVAALLEDRLKEKVFTFGDVTKGQFKAAVKIANEYLEHPIGLPVSCDIKLFFERVSKLPIEEVQKMKVIEEFYLGKKDKELGDCIRQYFKAEVIRKYWKKEFRECQIGSRGFKHIFQKYINWGFELSELFEIVDFENGDKKENCEKFISTILDSKLFLKQKRTIDPLVVDVEEERPYSVATLFAQVLFGGAKNTTVVSYLPIERIEEILEKNLGADWDVKAYIKTYLKKEEKQDISDQFLDFMEEEREKLIQERKEYDITDYDLLRFYETGDTILPKIETAIRKSREFLNSTLKEEKFKELLKEDILIEFHWLTIQNRYYYIRQEDWEKIYEKLREPNGLARYYSLFRIQLSSQNLVDMALALLLNDDLWEYSSKIR